MQWIGLQTQVNTQEVIKNDLMKVVKVKGLTADVIWIQGQKQGMCKVTKRKIAITKPTLSSDAKL